MLLDLSSAWSVANRAARLIVLLPHASAWTQPGASGSPAGQRHRALACGSDATTPTTPSFPSPVPVRSPDTAGSHLGASEPVPAPLVRTLRGGNGATGLSHRIIRITPTEGVDHVERRFHGVTGECSIRSTEGGFNIDLGTAYVRLQRAKSTVRAEAQVPDNGAMAQGIA